jgi:hypothetical protein
MENWCGTFTASLTFSPDWRCLVTFKQRPRVQSRVALILMKFAKQVLEFLLCANKFFDFFCHFLKIDPSSECALIIRVC